MSMPQTRRKAEWLNHYDEPEIKVPDEFQELDVVVVDDSDDDHKPQAIFYGPDDNGDACDWFQIDCDALVVPER